MSGRAQKHQFGVVIIPPLQFLVTETDGSTPGLDLLPVCEDGLVATGLNVRTPDFVNVDRLSPLHASLMPGVARPTGCGDASEAATRARGNPTHS